MSSLLLPHERLQRCTRELRGVMDRGPVEVNHCSAWRARRRAQRTDHAKATMLLPHRGELKILFSPGSQINKVLRVFQISKKKKKKSHYQLSNQIDWWVVLSTGSLYLASDAKTGVKARSLYWKCIHLWAGGTNQHHCVLRGRNHGIPRDRLPQWPQSWIFTNYEVGNCQSLYKLIYLGIPSRWPVPSVL